MNILFITGLPAAGKTTVTRRLFKFYPAVWGYLDHIGNHRPFHFDHPGFIEVSHYMIKHGIKVYETHMGLNHVTITFICRSKHEYRYISTALDPHKFVVVSLYGDPEILSKRAFERQSVDPERCGGKDLDFYRKRIYDLYEVYKNPEPWHGIRIDTSVLTKNEVCESVRDVCESAFGPAPGLPLLKAYKRKELENGIW